MYHIFKIGFIFLLITGICASVSAQDASISFYLLDEHTKEAIAYAHAFINNTESGTISNEAGYCKLPLRSSNIDDIVISHLAYDTKIIPYTDYNQRRNKDTIYLHRNSIELDEITISGKKDKSWKKNYKRFKKEFLGQFLPNTDCRILNPEVLRFTTTDTSFTASAVDLIKIENKYLGYQLNFILTKFTIDNSGWINYKGYSHFTDLYPADEKYLKRRVEVYHQSPKFFYRSLINHELNENLFKIHTATYSSGSFTNVKALSSHDILKYDSLTQYYSCSFDDFLNIDIGYATRSIEVNISAMPSSEEQQKYNTISSGPESQFINQSSQLYKSGPYILLDRYGNIINLDDIKEFGYWGLQRISQILPSDFGLGIKINNSELEDNNNSPSSFDMISQILYADRSQKFATLKYIEHNWVSTFSLPLLDILNLSNDVELNQEILSILNNYHDDQIKNYFDGIRFLWTQDSTYSSEYSNIKAEIYKNVDKKFKYYFKNRSDLTKIRLDEIIWGGVKQDGIPPLKYPQLLEADEANYLGDDDIIFGISIDGESRAYPKRIMGWHEMVIDTISQERITGVYCTLCGTMIAYNNEHDGIKHHLGTSGFLYRSNKLMYDVGTQSLWSTIDGAPVVGPLINTGIQLDVFPIVTTTWGEWKDLHPHTKVLSLDTGYQRDYSEGSAYANYYATDALMFPVLKTDQRLKNKDEVFIVRIPENIEKPAAYSADKLIKENLFQDTIGQINIVFISGAKGNIRAYDREGINFNALKNNLLKDDHNGTWKITDDYLINQAGKKLNRLPAHRIFWFAWYAANPETRLVK